MKILTILQEPGLFYSKIIDKKEIENIEKIIKKNMYDEFLKIRKKYFHNIKLNLLIQQYIDGKGGVIVTKDFITRSPNNIILSFSKYGPSYITSGKDKGNLYMINKKNKKIITLEKIYEDKVSNYVDIIIETVNFLEKIFHTTLEVEYVISNSNIYILQARNFNLK